MESLSVVVSVFNDEKNIAKCLKSVEFANEVIVVNSSSTDNSKKIAASFTKKIYTRENYAMLNKNKNFGFTKANSKWILSLDSDEVVSDELRREILEILEKGSSNNGYFIPRKNYIFGKWIQHTGWYPDYQLRLFRRGKGEFKEEHVHEMIKVDGDIKHLNNPIVHQNYESVDQFLKKMIQNYTISEAENLMKKGYVFSFADAFKFPSREFFKRYFYEEGYKDGSHGLILSLLMAFYHFVVFVRIWEKRGYDQTETLPIVKTEFKLFKNDMKYWINHEQIKKTPKLLRPIIKIIHKLQ